MTQPSEPRSRVRDTIVDVIGPYRIPDGRAWEAADAILLLVAPDLEALRGQNRDLESKLNRLRGCTQCGALTDLCCSDCQIDLKALVRVCERPECRDGHERDCPATLRARLRAAEMAIERLLNTAQMFRRHVPEGDAYEHAVSAARALLSPAKDASGG